IRHIAQKHSIPLPFECTFCHRKYKKIYDLNQHMATHVLKTLHEHKKKQMVHEPRNSLYKCYCCGEIFTSSISLTVHMETHINTLKNGIKVYRCMFCGYETIYNSTFKRHLDKHSDERQKRSFTNFSTNSSLLVLMAQLNLAQKVTP
ncbi:unnamed protein product, partial [Meganyctiphanes norvegica]